MMSLENEEYDLLQIVSKAVKEMSEGELLQIEKARKLDIEEDIFRNYQTKNSNTYCGLLCLWCCHCQTKQRNCRAYAKIW